MKKIITEEQKQKIIELSARGFNNRQIAIECGVKHATLGYWKRKMRDQGVFIPSLLGRPRHVKNGIATIEEMKKQDINTDIYHIS